MIERKDVKHMQQPHHNEAIGVHTDLNVGVTQYVSTYATDDVWKKVKQYNEEAIRRKLYGDVVDELLRIRQEIRSGPLDPRVLAVERIGLLIDKLEWKDGLES